MSGATMLNLWNDNGTTISPKNGSTIGSATDVITDGVTCTTQSPSDNSTKLSSTAYVDSAVSTLVTGAASSTDNGLVRFDGTTGKLIQDTSGWTLTDAGNMVASFDYAGLGGTFVTNSNSDAITIAGAVSRVTNDSGHYASISIASTASTFGSSAFQSAVNFYNQGYNNSLYTVDGNKDHVFYTDPTDQHNYTSLSNPVFKIKADGSAEVDVINEFTASAGVTVQGIKIPTVFDTALLEPTGFPNLTDSVVTFTDGTRTASIQPTATNFKYYMAGTEYTSTGDTVVIDDTEGLHYIYYVGSTLTATANPNDGVLSSVIRTNPLVTIIYWDATNNLGIYVGEERHGCQMDGNTHAYLHFRNGLSYVYGLALGDFVIDDSGDDAEDAQFSVATGGVSDEDIFQTIDAVGSTTGLPIYYRDGASGDWRKSTNAGYSVETTGTGRLAWNELTGGSWQLTEATNNNYILCHVFATTEKDNPMISIMGQGQYGNIISARQGAETEISNILLGSLPSPEFRPIGTVIFQTNDGYGNAVKGRTRTTDEGANYVDFRTSEISRSAAAADHASLAGLTWTGSGHTGTLSTIAGFDGSSVAAEYTLSGTGTELALTTNPTLTGATMAGNLDVDGNDIIGVGNLNIGADTGISTGSTQNFQILGTGASNSGGTISRFSANSNAPYLQFVKSRNATIGSNTIVNDNDGVGDINYYPADGVDFATLAAQFCTEVDDSSPAAGDIGMAFVWQQMPGGGGAIRETFRIAADGVITGEGGIYITRSDGDTGGTGSAGAGNQYVELEINGTTYKVLHDGTV